MLVLAWVITAVAVVARAVSIGADLLFARALHPVRTIAGTETRGVPSVSIVVAARDEAHAMRHEAEVFAAFDHPDIEFVLVNDRSTDATGELMEAIAARDPRVRVVHIAELPEGWLGKTHALEQGRKLARGEWLLFTDGDVELAPNAPRLAVEFAEHHRLDALAVLPRITSDGVLVAGVVATFARWLSTAGQLWRAADPDRPDAFGVGACNLVRRSALERAGGFEPIRFDIGDDAALGQLIASGGSRTMLASGIDLASVRWQESVRGMIRGFEKYGGTGGVGSIPVAIGLATLATIVDILPWIALVVSLIARSPFTLSIAVGTILVSTLFALALAPRFGAPRRGLICGPLAPTLVWWMQVRAAILEARRGGVIWRGTFYSTAELRAGKRYRLPMTR